MKKYALGIHHLNIAYCSGNLPAYHRQVRESVMPLLNLLNRHSNWCFSIEMCGASIEFIGTHYPHVLENICRLVNFGQIELISVTYAPQIWIAFPATDMIRSIQINQKVLQKYNLTASRIFFCQENFSSEGIKNLKEWYDVAIVKDDYYFHYHEQSDSSATAPYYYLGDVKLIIGSGHILETMAAHCNQPAPDYLSERISIQYQSLLSKPAEKTKKITSPQSCYKFDAVEWCWYHMGSSERFAKPNIRPENFSTCRVNSIWYSKIEDIILKYEKEGYSIAGINTFLNAISTTSFTASPSKSLIDGAWNMKECKAGEIWLNHNKKDFEDVLGVRNHNWFSRSRIISAECLLKVVSANKVETDKIQADLERAWKYQLLAESSDATGWFPEPSEVSDSITHSDLVLNIVANIVSYLRMRYQITKGSIDTQKGILIDRTYDLKKLTPESTYQPLIKKPIFFGGDHVVNFYFVDEFTQQIAIDFTCSEKKCGVIFELSLNVVRFSPALMDNELIDIIYSDLLQEAMVLPLPNGLIGIAPGIFLIKHNEFLNIGCCINARMRTINFEIINPKLHFTHWEFTVFKGSAAEALQLAKRINILPVVDL